MSGDTIRYEKCVCTENCTNTNQFKCEPIEFAAISASSKEAVPPGTARHYQKCVCKADCAKSDNFTCTIPENIVPAAPRAAAGAAAGAATAAAAAAARQCSTIKFSELKEGDKLFSDHSCWKNALTLLQNPETPVEVYYNGITGVLEASVTLKGSTVPLLLTGVTAYQLADSYYNSESVQAFLKNADTFASKSKASNAALQQQKNDLTAYIAKREARLASTNIEDQPALRANIDKAKAERQKLIDSYAAAAAAQKARQQALLNKPSVGIAGSSDTKKGEELVKQIKKNYYVENVKAIADLIDGGADLRVKNEDGNAAIHLACLRDAPLLVAKLLQIDSTLINFKNSNGNTILHLAAENNYKIIAKYVIDVIVTNKFSLDTVNNQNNTALHVACTSKSSSIACMLINAGADYNLVGSANKTAKLLGENTNSIKVCLLDAEKRAIASRKTRSRRTTFRRATTRRRR